MGVFKKIFGGKKIKADFNGYFQMLDGYTPSFTTYDEGVYEMELTRSCIHTFATHCSKLQPNVEGADLRRIQRMLETKPNEFMTSAQFLYKVATIYEAKNTCFIVPILDKFDRIIGFYPVNPANTEVVESGDGTPYLKFTFRNGQKAAMELSRVGCLSKYLYKNDIFGESNAALRHTLQLIQMQNQGIQEGIKNSASFRFMANVGNFAKEEDIAKYRKKFVEENFGNEGGGLALFPNTMTNVQQINSTAKVVDVEQMQLIQERCFMYFGTNMDVLENKAFGDSWSAYYEGKIEPFAIQLAQAMTSMVYTSKEIATGNAIVWTANRLQYMTNADKLNVSSALFDRGIMNRNMIFEIWNLPHTEDGDKFYIRREYIDIDELGDNGTEEAETEDETTGDDIDDTTEQEELEGGSTGTLDADSDSESETN